MKRRTSQKRVSKKRLSRNNSKTSFDIKLKQLKAKLKDIYEKNKNDDSDNPFAVKLFPEF